MNHDGKLTFEDAKVLGPWLVKKFSRPTLKNVNGRWEIKPPMIRRKRRATRATRYPTREAAEKGRRESRRLWMEERRKKKAAARAVKERIAARHIRRGRPRKVVTVAEIIERA